MGLFGGFMPQAFAADEAPEAMIKRLSDEVLAAIRADKSIQAGDTNKVLSLVDSKIMPNVDFRRMTAAAVGPAWRQATPEQQKRLQDEFKILLVRTYSGALAQVNDQTISLKPQRSSPTDTDVVVRTEVRGRGEPIELDYRLRMEDLQPERAGCVAGGDLSQPVRAGDQHQGRGRPDRRTGGAQQGQRPEGLNPE
jgi:phospholipid transport system substrate-binding protein